jgi:beta-phosphoglucomutase-like phosphatase (HAD superfamily)
MIQIVFDMDGVIFDTEALCQKAWRTVGEERGISIAEIDELLKLCIGSNQQHMTEVLREKLGVDFPVQCFLSEAAEQIQLLANEHLPLKKGAEELLKWLKEQKAAVGLASSTASPIVKKYLEKAGLTEYFQIIIGGDQVIHSKPDGEIYQMPNVICPDVIAGQSVLSGVLLRKKVLQNIEEYLSSQDF